MAGGDPSSGALVSFQQAGHLNPGQKQTGQKSLQSPGLAQAAYTNTFGAVFSIVPHNGCLPGRGLTMPQKQTLSVTFAPKQTGLCTAELTVAVSQGSSICISLSGQGTYNENDEVQARLKAV